jgi:hypothetical protein
MKAIAGAVIAMSLAGCGAGTVALGGGATQACEEFRPAYAELPEVLVRWRSDVFRYDDAVFDGCVLTVVGDAAGMPDHTPPAYLIHPGSSPGPSPASAPWEADREADGKDGASFRLRRPGAFCAVEGWWDGGDDLTPAAPRSSLFLITVRCAELT